MREPVRSGEQFQLPVEKRAERHDRCVTVRQTAGLRPSCAPSA